jgi:hypothetical protein
VGGEHQGLATVPEDALTPRDTAFLIGVARSNRADENVLARLAATLLGDGGLSELPRRSALNNDGTALQVCESCSPGVSVLRIVADPGAHARTSRASHERCLQALARTLLVTGAAQLSPLCETTLALTLPARPDRERDLAAGTLWLAASPTHPGVAVYVNARWGDEPERWRRGARWLAALLPGVGGASFIERTAPRARVASFALEGVDRERARAKLYFRLLSPLPLGEFGVSALSHDAMVQFLNLVVEEGAVPTSGLVISVGFSTADGHWSDAKLDVCAHCLPHDVDAWARLLKDLSQRLGLEVPRCREGVLRGDADVALVGCGVDRDGDVRLNVYLKEPRRGHSV